MTLRIWFETAPSATGIAQPNLRRPILTRSFLYRCLQREGQLTEFDTRPQSTVGAVSAVVCSRRISTLYEGPYTVQEGGSVALVRFSSGFYD